MIPLNETYITMRMKLFSNLIAKILREKILAHSSSFSFLLKGNSKLSVQT
jgi:hypothetical protein